MSNPPSCTGNNSFDRLEQSHCHTCLQKGEEEGYVCCRFGERPVRKSSVILVTSHSSLHFFPPTVCNEIKICFCCAQLKQKHKASGRGTMDVTTHTHTLRERGGLLMISDLVSQKKKTLPKSWSVLLGLPSCDSLPGMTHSNFCGNT